MKICILTPRFPFPENGGDVLRINNIARHLKAQGHELILVSFCEPISDTVSAKLLYDKIYTIRREQIYSVLYSFFFALRGKPIQCGYYYSRAFIRLLHKVVIEEKPDRYIAHLLRMSPYLENFGLEKSSIVEMTDALSKTYALSKNAKGGWLKKVVYKIEKKLILRYEKYVVNVFPKVVLVSQSDIDYISSQSETKIPSLSLHTNGVNCISKPNRSYDACKICFLGNMRTLQNQDAVLHFVNDIFPLILKDIPDAVFYIIGAEPSRSIINLANNKNIVVTGFIEDLETALSDICITVAPVQVAAGIQNKILVAMAHGLPVVMSSLISNAIPELKDGINCIIQDNNEQFAKDCVNLMRNKRYRLQLAEAGYEMVYNNFSWNEKLKGYEYIK